MQIALVYGREATLRPAAGPDAAGAGIPTALLQMSTALAARGHEVDVFAHCDEPGVHRGARYHARESLAAFGELHQPDALVVVPDGMPLLFPVRARARVLWTQNAFRNGDFALSVGWPWAPHLGRTGQTVRLYPLSLFGSHIDLVVATSRWQMGHLAQQMRLPEDRFEVAFNGVDLDNFNPGNWDHERHRIVYTSQARRGLDVLIERFPAIKAAVPQAELHIFSSEDPHTPLRHRAERTPGIYWRGRVSKTVLAEELRTAGIMAYPCTFNETFCTSVAEAQAAGLPVVCSPLAALAERVRDGVDGMVVDGDPRSPDYGPRFVEAVVRLLQNDALRVRMGRAGTLMAAQRYNWDRIAEQWEGRLSEITRDREPRVPRSSTLDLLEPALLTVKGRAGHSARVPAELAERWLRTSWASYGYDGRIPGLRKVSGVGA